MKPEILAMVDATDKGEYAVDTLPHIFLSSLHWRGDELWMGPVYFGVVYGAGPWFGKFYEHGCETDGYAAKPEARDALEAAAREQITKWFKEQVE